MKTLVKILLHTIRNNPEYAPPGYPVLIEGRREFNVYAEKKLPKFLEKYFYKGEHQLIGDEERNITYYLHKPLSKAARNRLENLSGIQVEMKHTPREITTRFSPQYLFSYANPVLRCDECLRLVRFKEIEYTVVVNDDDEFNAEQCPHCKEVNTFDYKLETIEEALKRKNNKTPDALLPEKPSEQKR